jgi:hypothetical protein
LSLAYLSVYRHWRPGDPYQLRAQYLVADPVSAAQFFEDGSLAVLGGLLTGSARPPAYPLLWRLNSRWSFPLLHHV